MVSVAMFPSSSSAVRVIVFEPTSAQVNVVGAAVIVCGSVQLSVAVAKPLKAGSEAAPFASK